MNFKNSLLFFSIVFVSTNLLGVDNHKVYLGQQSILFEKKPAEVKKIRISSQFNDSEYKKKIAIALEKALEKQHSQEKIDIKDLEIAVIEQYKKTEDNSLKIYKNIALGASGVAVGALGSVAYLLYRINC